jgi:hypothetical protein
MKYTTKQGKESTQATIYTQDLLKIRTWGLKNGMHKMPNIFESLIQFLETKEKEHKKFWDGF